VKDSYVRKKGIALSLVAVKKCRGKTELPVTNVENPMGAIRLDRGKGGDCRKSRAALCLPKGQTMR